MMRLYIGRIWWLVLLTPILLLETRIDIPTWIVGESAVSGRLAALVTCVLPAAAEDPSATSTSVPDTITPDCEISAPDPLRAVLMTAC